MERLQEIKVIVSTLEVELEKFYQDDNKAASVRARKALMQIKKSCHEARKEILETRKDREAAKCQDQHHQSQKGTME